jgi:Phosphotransferase enzyme family
MDTPPPRIVTLVLVDTGGAVLGSLPPFEAETPWWMDIAPVVRAVLARDGVRVTVLRLLQTERPFPGGAVTYLAQLDAGSQPAPVRPWKGALPDHPKRHPYARVGGPQADLAWAGTVLADHGAALTGVPQQIRSWNLSSIWCLPSTLGPVWLKVVPPFFAHEGVMLAALGAMASAPVPRLLGHEGGRMLLVNIEGVDLHDAPLPQCLQMIGLLVELQKRWLGRADELASLGLPDWRGPAFTSAIAALVGRRGGELEPDELALLNEFVSSLPARFAALAACGIADGLVHGDFHPGNVRGNAQRLTLLDWGDCGIGHPLLDQPAFLDRVPTAGVASARAHWAGLWRQALPHADIERASQLLAPIASARQALIYQRFLDAIEDAEHPYHRADVGVWLRRTADRLRADAAR